MGLVKDQALVLRKLAYGESDKIMRLLTLNGGKISAIAKGGAKSLKRFMNTLEPFKIIALEYFEKPLKGLARIENAHVLEDFSVIERDFSRLCVASFFIELIDKLTKEKESHPDLFWLLAKVFRKLQYSQISSREILSFTFNILELLGFLPNFKTCVHCGRKIDDKRFFSCEKGGILCEQCRRFHPHKAYPTELLSFLSDKDEKGEIEDRLLVSAFELMENFMRYHLDQDFKSLRFLRPKTT